MSCGCNKAKRPGVGQMVKGAIGLAKATAGIDEADDGTIRLRFARCVTCPSHDAGRCDSCGCWIGPKIRVASESCPEGRWPAE